MTTIELGTVKPEINRDRWGRPLIVPPNGGKPRGYSRPTTIAGTLDDLYGLMKWKQRQTAIGLADRRDLMVAVTAHRDDKKQMDRLCEDAMEAAASSSSATIGTAVHKLSEMVDSGQELPTVDELVRADLEAYAEAMRPFTVVEAEQMVVCDEIEAAGTPDRVVEWRGKRFILDLKTGSSLDFSMGKIAMQLAIYAHSQRYDPATGERTDLDVHQGAGIVVHVPAGTGTAEVVWVDLRSGWEAVQLAMQVRDWRKRRDLRKPFQES